MVVYVKTRYNSAVVYKVKSTGPSTEPCRPGTGWCLFFKLEEKQILVSPDFPYQSESLFVDVAWSMVSRAANKSSDVRAVTSPLSILIMISL